MSKVFTVIGSDGKRVNAFYTSDRRTARRLARRNDLKFRVLHGEKYRGYGHVERTLRELR